MFLSPVTESRSHPGISKGAAAGDLVTASDLKGERVRAHSLLFLFLLMLVDEMSPNRTFWPLPGFLFRIGNGGGHWPVWWRRGSDRVSGLASGCSGS